MDISKSLEPDDEKLAKYERLEGLRRTLEQLREFQAAYEQLIAKLESELEEGG